MGRLSTVFSTIFLSIKRMLAIMDRNTLFFPTHRPANSPCDFPPHEYHATVQFESAGNKSPCYFSLFVCMPITNNIQSPHSTNAHLENASHFLGVR